jgi:hypothetical protein
MKNDENKKVNEVIEAKTTEDTTTQTEKEPEKKGPRSIPVGVRHKDK